MVLNMLFTKEILDLAFNNHRIISVDGGITVSNGIIFQNDDVNGSITVSLEGLRGLIHGVKSLIDIQSLYSGEHSASIYGDVAYPNVGLSLTTSAGSTWFFDTNTQVWTSGTSSGPMSGDNQPEGWFDQFFLDQLLVNLTLHFPTVGDGAIRRIVGQKIEVVSFVNRLTESLQTTNVFGYLTGLDGNGPKTNLKIKFVLENARNQIITSQGRVVKQEIAVGAREDGFFNVNLMPSDLFDGSPKTYTIMITGEDPGQFKPTLIMSRANVTIPSNVVSINITDLL